MLFFFFNIKVRIYQFNSSQLATHVARVKDLTRFNKFIFKIIIIYLYDIIKKSVTITNHPNKIKNFYYYEL
jgi:hypothetical protein